MALIYIPGASPSKYVEEGAAFTLGQGDDAQQYLAGWTLADVIGLGGEKVTPEGEHGDERLFINSEVLAGPVRRLIATARPIAEVQPALTAYLADRRWRAEVQGTVWNDWPVATDRESQAKISHAYQLARDGYWSEGAGWKFADGVYRVLSGPQAQELALAVAAHVQGGFGLEAALAGQIALGKISDFATIDAAFDKLFPPPQTE